MSIATSKSKMRGNAVRRGTPLKRGVKTGTRLGYNHVPAEPESGFWIVTGLAAIGRWSLLPTVSPSRQSTATFGGVMVMARGVPKARRCDGQEG